MKDRHYPDAKWDLVSLEGEASSTVMPREGVGDVDMVRGFVLHGTGSSSWAKGVTGDLNAGRHHGEHHVVVLSVMKWRHQLDDIDGGRRCGVPCVIVFRGTVWRSGREEWGWSPWHRPPWRRLGDIERWAASWQCSVSLSFRGASWQSGREW
ncbi:hypothetical protein CFC21_081426 [Triticum aestivum]|uniref:Uncharacterized protein n=2 Tax=Triticum aestivum TaxID=4565 RepID=A0A9R1L480_WHEAT|nr:hypothetical protein CFC21_081426 [Triticum aestivum]